MSATGEERSKKRSTPEARLTSQQRQNSAAKEANAQIQRRGKDGTSEQNLNNKTPAPPFSSSVAPQDDYVALKGFNATEVEALLQRGFDGRAPVYKPDTQPQKSGNVWGAKAGAMANGKDFWLELRKQVTAIQQTGGVSQGG